MRRVLALLSLAGTLLVAGACHYDVNLSVDADADLILPNLEVIRVDPVRYEGFHHKHLTEDDLNDIFLDLTRRARCYDFTSAVLHLVLYDEISRKTIGEETYGVIYDNRTGQYEFAEKDKY